MVKATSTGFRKPRGMLKSRPKNRSNYKTMLPLLNVFNLNLVRSAIIFGLSQITRQLSMKNHPEGQVPAKNGLSTRISKDPKKGGFKFVGPVTIYSHLQASGLINDHGKDCPCFDEINQSADIVRLPADEEGYYVL